MRCAVCNKEIERSASDKAIVCEKCNAEIEQRLKEKESVKTILTDTFVKEKEEEKENINRAKYIKSLPNPVAERIESHNNWLLLGSIIASIVFFVLYFVYDFEYISFLITGLSILGVSLFIHSIVSGLAEIINLLDKIYNK